jgi:hypothetical protein
VVETADDDVGPVLQTAESASDALVEVGNVAGQGVFHGAFDPGIAQLLGIEIRRIGRQVGHREIARMASQEGSRTVARWAFSRSQTISRGLPVCRRKCCRAWITTELETLPRTCRAYNRPAGVTATTLDTSRRLLSRCRTGVTPRRAQVVPGRARKLCPVSSRKTIVRPSRRA